MFQVIDIQKQKGKKKITFSVGTFSDGHNTFTLQNNVGNHQNDHLLGCSYRGKHSLAAKFWSWPNRIWQWEWQMAPGAYILSSFVLTCGFIRNYEKEKKNWNWHLPTTCTPNCHRGYGRGWAMKQTHWVTETISEHLGKVTLKGQKVC